MIYSARKASQTCSSPGSTVAISAPVATTAPVGALIAWTRPLIGERTSSDDSPFGESAAGPEGCLSFPEMYADIARPESVDVVAMNEKGERIEFRCGGLLARAAQHETDHLNGILFIDRMSAATKVALRSRLKRMQRETVGSLKS